MMDIHRTACALAFAAIMLGACGGGDAGSDAAGDALTGNVETDGSSTVFPITEAMAEEFSIAHRGNATATVGMSGTGGGFKRFCAGEIDVSNASRPITESERAQCEASGVAFTEIEVALDGLAVAVHPENTFVECLTVAELKRIWEPNSMVQRWSQVRSGFPDEPLRLYGPGTNSGTFDYFTEAIVGEARASRPDYTASEDDNVLVQGVEGDRFALGYFGYAYYIENADRLKAVGVDGGNGCILPAPETVTSGQYAPLSRPLFIYVNNAALVARPAVREFVKFYLENAAELVPQVGYVALPPTEYQSALAALEQTRGQQ
ncbi:MAG: PstS family phosphate ABC transporter substrate-binding protein [Longimicrobiales bacterium]